ncbi:MAG: energy-coupling factor ABC transporter ATP-binding protein [Anaerolineae bacterium]|nr:energy-coupling factor ABC transporter ATP-binding protein [Anaerolineae bacterium]
MSVAQGEKVALVGANGAGKSTLIGHLNGVLRGSGTVRIDGLEMDKANLGRIRALVGVVFQDPDDQLFSPTVFEDVAFGPTYQGHDKPTIRRKAHQALEAVHMGDYAGRNPYHLSSGEKKRIAIATVLSMDPRILVLDEPTAGLDPRSRRELIELLLELPQTMVIATHDLALVERLTSRTVVLGGGEVAAEGSTPAILEDEDLLARHGLR